MPTLKETVDLLRDNWRKNLRHHGGLVALARCSYGTWSLNTRAPLAEDGGSSGVDCVTFSVVPNLTALWSVMMKRAIPDSRARIWVGDCSGGFRKARAIAPDVRYYPMVNYLHGLKLDLFLNRFLRSEFVVVSDDDVIWLNQEPWLWAMKEFARDPATAVVALAPRLRFHWNLDGRQYQPMGSYCLIVRRSIWLKESLSFQAVPKASPSASSYGGLYDTCDFANVELIKRGYRIAIAPDEIRGRLAAFKGISSAVLRIQKDPPEGYAAAYGDGPEPIVETCLAAVELKRIIERLAPPGYPADLARPDLIERAYREMLPLVAPDRLAIIENRVATLAKNIAASLEGAETPALAGKTR
jgi:hypothetical protein